MSHSAARRSEKLLSRAWRWPLLLLAWIGGIALQLQQGALWPALDYLGLGAIAAFILIAAQAVLAA